MKSRNKKYIRFYPTDNEKNELTEIMFTVNQAQVLEDQTEVPSFNLDDFIKEVMAETFPCNTFICDNL